MRMRQSKTFSRSPDWGTWGLSVVNGLVGDRLAERRNGLAIKMGLYQRGRRLRLNPYSLSQAHPNLTNRICVFVHGFACNEDVWTFTHPSSSEPVTYGELLQRDLGYTPFYVRYNTGMALAHSGRSLATLLDQLVSAYPIPVEEIALFGHSMGGLVIRGAIHYGARENAPWVDKVCRVFYLGAPHAGVELVKLGFTATNVLRAMPDPVSHFIADILDTTSQGVKDMRYSTPLVASEQDEVSEEQETVIWHSTARHYFIAGSITEDPTHIVARIMGDGLVSMTSAQSPCNDEAEQWKIPDCQVKLFPGLPHLQLTCHHHVYAQIHDWCKDD